MNALFFLIDTVIEIYLFFIFVWVIMSWLVSFGVVPTYNRYVVGIMDFLYRVTEPALGRIRQFLPPFGGIDLSPIILILALYFIRNLIRYDIAPALGVGIGFS